MDKIKRDARARMAETGETYTEARRAVAHTTDRPPTLAQMRDAVDVFLRAWAPGTVLTPVDDDEWDETNGCRCGGNDCNCGNGCYCDNCRHSEHAETRRCRLRVPRPDMPYAWCGKETRFRVVGFCVHRDGITRGASDGDPAVNEMGNVTLGDSIQRHAPMYACSTQHARALIEADRANRNDAAPDSVLSAANTFYEVEPFEYVPDEIDVPGPLTTLVHHLDSARFWAGGLLGAVHGTGRGSVGYNADGMYRYLAWSLYRAVEYAGQRTDD